MEWYETICFNGDPAGLKGDGPKRVNVEKINKGFTKESWDEVLSTGDIIMD